MTKETALKRIGSEPIPDKGYTGAGQVLRGNARLGSMESATIDIPGRGFTGFHVDADGNLGIGGTTATNGTFTVDADSGVFGAPNALSPVQVTKLADEIVNNSDTLQDDDELVFTVEAGHTYITEAFFWVTGNTFADVKLKWTDPDTGSPTSLDWEIHNASGDVLTGAMGDTLTPGTVDTTFRAIPLLGRLVTGTYAGRIQLKWAQNTAHASNTTMHLGSYIRATLII